MRAILREHSTRVMLTVTASLVGVGSLAAVVMNEVEITRRNEGLEVLPTWVTVLVVVACTGLGLFIAHPMTRSLADRTSETLAAPVRRLTHRTDEMASGGFALDPQARPGRLVDPGPWHSGILEVDALAREIDRHHQTFARALVFERSFAADASHQLRTPLAALLLRLEEIAQSDDAAVARGEADIAIAQVERLTGVVDELLRRTRAGHASGGAVSAVDTVLAGLDEEWTPAFEEAGRQIRLTCERGVIVETSSSALSQVLNTLVENALIHGGGGVDVHVARSGPSAVVTVADHGRGVPDELSRAIFDRGRSTGEGTGLGLAVARETVESFGGRLELVQTRPAVFAAYLPLAVTS